MNSALRLATAGALVAVSMGWADVAGAQSPAPKQPAKSAESGSDKQSAPKQDAAAAQKSVETGIAALDAGKVDEAVANLSSGIGSGSLPGSQMARALYYRGVAYRKQNKPALAIADLTSALWLRGGLSGDLRQEAQQQRAAAYREAGLPDQSAAGAVRAAARAGDDGGDAKSGAPIEPGSGASSGSSSTTSSVAVAPGGTFSGVNNLFSSLFGSGAPAAPAPVPAPAPAPAETAPAPPAASPSIATSSWRQSTEVKQTAPDTAETRQAAPVKQAVPPAKSWSETTTASIPATAPAAVPVKQAVSPAKSWNETTTASIPAAAPTGASAPAVVKREPPAESTPRATSGGRYRLQLAAVRSQAEAQALAERVRQKHGAVLGGLRTEIDQTAVGNMGTLYRVRLGPFADANAPRALCAKLKGDGLDCLIVTQ